MPPLNTRQNLATLLALGTLCLATSPPLGCGGEWCGEMSRIERPQKQIDYRPINIPKAEDKLEKGFTISAAGLVLRTIPHLQTLSAIPGSTVERAQRVMAVITARHAGAIPLGYEVPKHATGSWLGTTEEDRAKNLSWAVQVMKQAAEKKTADPVFETELAETLAASPSHRAEGKKRLESLAKRDLLATPEGYAKLAQLRQDKAGKKLALKRCTEMTKNSAICRGDIAQS